ncbi:response regulator [Spirosoma panaciterrae]|uniref:response regulator n=1 Tax=Spirosoma panaciterrae TaxID=496058 RepID=UPI00036E9333|nr:response regulator transcription factor [Spirosoma panaciterrae]
MNSSQGSILIADDHRMFNDAVAGMLRPIFGLVWQVFDGFDLQYAIQTHSPDLLLLDINLPNLNGLEAARTLRLQVPKLKIILVTMYNHSHFVTEAQTLGLEGYLLKDSPSEVLINGIQTVLDGNRFFDPKLQKMPELSDDFVKSFLLTRREKEIIKGLVSGKSAEQIANELCIAYETVKSHRKNIYLKLGINSIVELVRISRAQGWSE